MSWRLGLSLIDFKNSQLAVTNQVWRIYGPRFSHKSDSVVKHNDERLVETKPLSGYVYDEGIEGFKSKWRIPFMERKSFFKSKFSAFASKKFPGGGLMKWHPKNIKYLDLAGWWKTENREKLVYDQRFSEERLMALGCDLAAAHFTVYRGGAVKFVGKNEWIRDKKTNRDYDDDLPGTYNPNYSLEAIDFSNTRIIYEGLKNIDNLPSLKWLSFSNCEYFDDWCLDRVSGEHRNLEYLDISFTKVTHRGLHALYRFSRLKNLRVDETNSDPLYFQTCLELMKEFKSLNVELVSNNQQLIEPGNKVSSHAEV